MPLKEATVTETDTAKEENPYNYPPYFNFVVFSSPFLNKAAQELCQKVESFERQFRGNASSINLTYLCGHHLNGFNKHLKSVLQIHQR